MAYGKKYSATIKDTLGNEYITSILKKNYTGSSETIASFSTNPLSIAYRGGREAEGENILPSECNFTFYSTAADLNKYDEIFESDFKDYQLEVTKKTNTITGYNLFVSVESENLTESGSGVAFTTVFDG